MKTMLFTVGLVALCACQISAQTIGDNPIQDEVPRMCAERTRPIKDREIDCLRGLINSVHSEIVVLLRKGDTYVHGPTTQIKDVSYDRQGNAVERIVYGFDYNYQKHVESRVVYAFDDQ